MSEDNKWDERIKKRKKKEIHIETFYTVCSAINSHRLSTTLDAPDTSFSFTFGSKDLSTTGISRTSNHQSENFIPGRDSPVVR